MNRKIRCAHCRRVFYPDPRVKNQRYCSAKGCQRARKNLWQRRKMATDTDYRANQKDCQKNWHKRHPGYWRQYRSRRSEYRRANRFLQKHRDEKRRFRRLAKMDALRRFSRFKAGTYYLVENLAKMDVSAQKVCFIPTR